MPERDLLWAFFIEPDKVKTLFWIKTTYLGLAAWFSLASLLHFERIRLYEIQFKFSG